ncbi:tRNA 4-thiouridine(8) synthase ThiI [Actinoallomurus purpureus]|uniref:tRNA uracil 4-sulfurtransferase ThiI n=1 Tax=Actinoallomurus purpureus TaxID=478114 RepID=UPI002093DE3A|nr:tRNA uracil 4-sulfurtransferase ThiI [Actinoallomurus purpureus]MCO6005712.1 tRNA 4-thiouridine(8) synthase ThiI [Actinoallomurus purpureus]
MPTLETVTQPQNAERPAVAGEPCVLLKLGEIVLKGKNRELFERRLQNNIRAAVKGLGIKINVWQREGVIVVRAESGELADVDAVARRLTDVMGIVWVHRAWRVAKDVDATVQAALDLVAQHPALARKGAFAIRARRRDKRFPITSSDLNVLVGSKVKERYDLPVNLKHPDLAVFIEVDQREVFVFTDGMPGAGGLPVGMSGRALVLMSGGIDSPVAAYRMMRRGLRVDFLHFSGMPFTGPESIYKAYALVRELDKFQGGSRLFVVPFGKAQQQIKSSGADRLQIIAQRRLMLKTGEVVAHKLGGAALITGDSLGQVSSQTMQNITALDDAVNLPILRPLIGMDKTEIMAEARRIHTLSISELPDEDCCTVLTPRRAETRAKIDDLRQIEKRLDAGEMAEQLAGNLQEHRPGYGEPTA